jgi:peptidoglycan lytic transglycosylase
MSAHPRVRSLPALLVLGIGLALAGCASGPGPGSGHRAGFRIGQPNYTVSPYQVNGVWYYPKVDYSYDRTGTASWYGEQFNERPTSDGEIFDMNELSAAHKTLPLPSVVEVTNLQNGRELQLRVNDRGPFVDGRLIDVSRRAAQLLGFERSGTAPVRVRVLKDQSIAVAEAAMHGGYGPVGVAAAPRTRQTALAAAAPPRRLPPPVQMAAATPPSLRAAEIIGAPVISAPRQSTPIPFDVRPVAPPARAAEPPRFAMAAPPRPAVAEAPRHYWPSLIAPAQAATLHGWVVFAPRRVAAATKNAGRIFIQAGAFAVPENAQRVRARIAALGSVEVVPTRGNGMRLYRVRLGPVSSEAAAAQLLDKVVGRGYPGARVVEE